MSVRAKFLLASVANQSWGGQTFRFQAVHDVSTDENRRFTKATPNGHVEIAVDNPEVASQFELGKYYYADFTPAE